MPGAYVQDREFAEITDVSDFYFPPFLPCQLRGAVKKSALTALGEKYREVVLLTHRLSLFPTDGGRKFPCFLFIDGPPNISLGTKQRLARSRPFFRSCLSFIIHRRHKSVK